MTRFVELPSIHGKLIWINPDLIVIITQASDIKTRIWTSFDEDSYWEIALPMAEVIARLSDPLPVQPPPDRGPLDHKYIERGLARLRRTHKQAAVRNPIYTHETINIAPLIADLRRKKHWTQEYLAMKIGVGRTVVSNWETGIAIPARHHVEAMERVLRADLKGNVEGNGLTP